MLHMHHETNATSRDSGAFFFALEFLIFSEILLEEKFAIKSDGFEKRKAAVE